MSRDARSEKRVARFSKNAVTPSAASLLLLLRAKIPRLSMRCASIGWLMPKPRHNICRAGQPVLHYQAVRAAPRSAPSAHSRRTNANGSKPIMTNMSAISGLKSLTILVIPLAFVLALAIVNANRS